MAVTSSAKMNEKGATFAHEKQKDANMEYQQIGVSCQGGLVSCRASCIPPCPVYCLYPRLAWRSRKHSARFARSRRHDKMPDTRREWGHIRLQKGLDNEHSRPKSVGYIFKGTNVKVFYSGQKFTCSQAWWLMPIIQFDTSLGNMVKPYLYKKIQKLAWHGGLCL